MAKNGRLCLDGGERSRPSAVRGGVPLPARGPRVLQFHDHVADTDDPWEIERTRASLPFKRGRIVQVAVGGAPARNGLPADAGQLRTAAARLQAAPTSVADEDEDAGMVLDVPAVGCDAAALLAVLDDLEEAPNDAG